MAIRNDNRRMLLNKQKVLSKGQFRKRGDGKSPDEVIVKRLGIFVFSGM